MLYFLKDFRRKTPSAAVVASVLSFFFLYSCVERRCMALGGSFSKFWIFNIFRAVPKSVLGKYGKPSQKVWLGIVYVVESVSHCLGSNTHIRIWLIRQLSSKKHLVVTSFLFSPHGIITTSTCGGKIARAKKYVRSQFFRCTSNQKFLQKIMTLTLVPREVFFSGKWV